MDLSACDPAVVKKYEMMRTKNEFLLQTFREFPISENVVQNYRCSCQQGQQTLGGKMWITQNFLLFTSTNGLKKTQISFMEIKGMSTNEGFVGYTSEIVIDLDSGQTIIFRHLYHFWEANTLLRYLMDHSPCYYHIPVSTPSISVGPPNPSKKEEKKSQDRGRWSHLQPSTQEAYTKPDVKLAEDCLELADKIFMNGIDIRGQLEDDACALDRIERDLTETSYNVKKAGRNIDAIESCPGAIKKVVMETLIDKKLGAYEAPDRRAGKQDAEQFYDVPILIKHPNCDLEPAILRFGDDKFFCANYPGPTTKEITLMRDYTYSYTAVSSVLIRVRPLHVDVKFLNEKESVRLRCVSSHIQMIANELDLRTVGRVKITFEPGTRKFDYGDEWLRRHPLQSNRSQSNTLSLFSRQSMATIDVVSDAPKEIIQAVAQTDEIIGKLQQKVDNIRTNTEDNKEETARQTEQTKKIHKKLDGTMEGMHKREHDARRLV